MHACMHVTRRAWRGVEIQSCVPVKRSKNETAGLLVQHVVVVVFL